jgi:hypothetical protein
MATSTKRRSLKLFSIVVSALKEVGLLGLSPTLAVFIERLGSGNLKTGLLTRSTLKLTFKN